MRGKAISWRFFAAGGLVLLCLLLMVITFGCKEKTEEAVSEEQTKEVSGKEKSEELISEEQIKQFVFNLDEVSVFDVGEVSRYFLRGQSTSCKDGSYRPVKYPVFKSEKPLYGRINFAGRPAEFHAPAGYHFALDESAGTGKGYDRLYFDHNCDLYLTNEKPLKPMKNQPDGALPGYSSVEQDVCFDSFKITFDFGTAGERAIEIMPRLTIRQGGRSRVYFVASKVGKCQIDIDGVRYDALLGYSYSIGGRFDHGGAFLNLIPKSRPQDYPRWPGANQLRAIHKIGGKYYSFSATPAGDKLFMRPYEGQLGTFEVGPGGRDVQEMALQGSLRSRDGPIATGGELEKGWPMPTRSCQLPIGDYCPVYLTVTVGQTQVIISDNYYRMDSQGHVQRSHKSFHGIKIRQDQPYVLDFSAKPQVWIVQPVKDHRLRLGSLLRVEAVLIDPRLDIMIRRLYDTSRKQKQEYVTSDGQQRTIEISKSLEPKVLITRADGEKVAEGVMPFG